MPALRHPSLDPKVERQHGNWANVIAELDLSSTADKCLLRARVRLTKGLYTYTLPPLFSGALSYALGLQPCITDTLLDQTYSHAHIE